MKNVLITITTMFGGGAERVVSVWSDKLISKGYDVSLLLYGREENEYPINDKVKVYSVAKTYVEYKKLGYFTRLKKMRKLVKKISPDVIINFLPRMQIWMMMATFGTMVPKIETVRVSPWQVCKNRKSEKYLWKRCFRKSKAIIVQTAEQAEYFNKKQKKKCIVISNPIDEKYHMCFKTEYPSKIKNFVAAGRITQQKNYPLMIKAFAKACENNEYINLSIYGVGDEVYTKNIQDLIDEYKMTDRIKLMGRTNNMSAVLRHADAFIMTSDYEGMPNALLEAMATGLVCISTDCRTGPKDMIDNEKNGFLAKVGDVEDVAEKISKTLKLDCNDAATMGKAAREKIFVTCSEQQSLQKLIDTIEKVGKKRK